MDIRAILREFNIYPNRSLGQNFLRNDTTADFIVECAKPTKKDTFLEVGPGLGILTTRLLDTGAKVIAVEKDSQVANGLSKHLEEPENLEIIRKDILHVDLDSLKFNKVISNLPFQISSPFTFKMLETKFELGVITYQLEFARRLTAGVGQKDYSRLTVMAHIKAEMKILRKIKAGAFFPPPKVDAAVVEIIPRKKPPFEIKDPVFFEGMVRELFNHRRKKIRNSLKSAYKVLGKGIDEKRYKTIVEQLPWGDMRPERLSSEELGELANNLMASVK
jgi:16S rRNA (adenine1518-N6/adenine1519-N6)-dimethyltransferase